MEENIKFEYTETNELISLIEKVYFGENNNGKLPENPSEHIKLDPKNLYYQILSGLNYSIKIKNEDIIEGTMKFEMIEHDEGIDLIPSSKYCVKIMDQKKKKEKYSFY